MKKLFIFYFQVAFVAILVLWIISFEQKIDFFWNGIVFSSSTSFILLSIILLILIVLLLQRFYLYISHSPKRIKHSLEISKYKKGIDSIIKAIVAISNNDNKELILQSKRIDNYLKDNPLGLVMSAEAAKKEKKYGLAEEKYNKMLLNTDTKILGLRGLLEQNLKMQDYHHAMIYAEQIYNINPKLNWIYETFVQIIIKTRNWQKLIEINNEANNKKIISKNKQQRSNAIALYEIALIKEGVSMRESLDLLHEAVNNRPNFAPITKKFISLLIDDNQLIRAQKILYKTWNLEPNQVLFDELVKIVNINNDSLVSAVNKLTKSNKDKYDNLIARVKANIYEKKWVDAKNIIKPALSVRPNKTICQLMSEIEMGISGNSQKANSWNSRASLGEPEKTWVCKHTNRTQDRWESVSQDGFFDSLEWTWPRNGSNDSMQQIEEAIPKIIGSN